MIPRDVKSPTAPIPFDKLLKVVAIVDPNNEQTKELLDHIKAEGFHIEICEGFDRDVSEDADVGAYIALVDGDRLEKARKLGRSVRAIGFQTPLWALADSHRISDLAVLSLTGEVDVARSVHRSLHEEDMAGQVVARHLRRPRGLLEVGATEAVHPPDDRRQQVGGAVGPDELQFGHPLEHPLGDHVHQVIQVVQRHEADVLLIGSRGARRRRGELGARTHLDVRRDRQIGVHGRLPQRPELRLPVHLVRLQRHADLHYPRVVLVLLDLAERARDVVRIDADGAAEPSGAADDDQAEDLQGRQASAPGAAAGEVRPACQPVSEEN